MVNANKLRVPIKFKLWFPIDIWLNICLIGASKGESYITGCLTMYIRAKYLNYVYYTKFNKYTSLTKQ